MKYVLAWLIAAVVPLSAAPLSGTKSIGPTGDYASIAAAIVDVQSQTLSGPIVLELQQDYLPAVETFPLTLGNLPTSTANTLTIRPESGATDLTITSADTTAATVDLNGAQFVTFDGRPGGVGTAKELTIANTSTSGVAVRFINEASDNTLRDLTLQGVNTSASGGTVVFSTTTGANGNDNNTIDSCDVRDGATTPRNRHLFIRTTRPRRRTTAAIRSLTAMSSISIARRRFDAAGVRLDTRQHGLDASWATASTRRCSRAAVAATVRAIHVGDKSSGSKLHQSPATSSAAIRAEGGGGTQKWTTTGTLSAAYPDSSASSSVSATPPRAVCRATTIKNMIWTSSMDMPPRCPASGAGFTRSPGNVNIGTVYGQHHRRRYGHGFDFRHHLGDGWHRIRHRLRRATARWPSPATPSAPSRRADRTPPSPPRWSAFKSPAGASVIYGTTPWAAPPPPTASTPPPRPPPPPDSRVTGILSSSNTSANIAGNTVANLDNNYARHLHAAAQIRGIVTSAGANTITGNTVRNLSTTSGNPTTTTAASSASGSASPRPWLGQTVSRNVVHSLANSTDLRSSSASVFGIYYAGNTDHRPESHRTRILVHSLAIPSTSTSSMVVWHVFRRRLPLPPRTTWCAWASMPTDPAREAVPR